MKFPMLVPCPTCGKRLTVETKGNEPYPDLQCECGATIYVVQSSIPVSRRVLCRAEAELLGEDFSLAIILSAMCVECELAFLHSKWKMLDAGLIPCEVTQTHTDAWEEEFRRVQGGITGKLDCITQLLVGENFDAFLVRRTDLATVLQQIHQNIGARSPKSYFAEELFRKRNKILHFGQAQFGKPEAEGCVRMAMSLLQIIGEIDKERYMRFDKSLDQRNAQPP